MKKIYIKYILTILFIFFAIRILLLFNDLTTALFLGTLAICVALSDDN